MAVNDEAGSVIVKFLHPHLPSPTYCRPSGCTSYVDISDIITHAFKGKDVWSHYQNICNDCSDRCLGSYNSNIIGTFRKLI